MEASHIFGSISHVLQLDTITPGSFLLTYNLVGLKEGNPEPILTVKIIQWRKFVDYFGLSVEAKPSRVVKKKRKFCPYWVYTNTSICNAPYNKEPYQQRV